MEKKAGAGLAYAGRAAVKQTGLKGGGGPFESLIGKLSPTLKRITCKLNGHFTFMDDQDLFQEALIHLWTDFQRGLLDDKTDSYILQGCYFHLKNYIRKSQDSVIMLSLNSIMEEDGSHLEELLIADNLASHDRVETLLEIEAMGSGISQRERDVLFFCLEGMTMREIGKRMGISHVSVVKIRNKIRERYQKLNGIAGGNGKTGKSLAA